MVVLAQEESRTLRHNYIGTEHLLLGLLREEEGLAARVLESLDITVERARTEVVRIVGSGEEVTAGQIPFTARAKKALELSLTEALSLGHNYIGTEHLLLGLVREKEGVAVQVLVALDADAKKIRHEMIPMLSGPEARAAADVKPAHSRSIRHPIDRAWFDGLGALLNGLAREIRSGLGREPDTGDLLLALACAPEALAAQALRGAGVDLDELQTMIERQRTERLPAVQERARESTTQMRDEEQRLIQAHEDDVVLPEVLQEIRQRLGVPRRVDSPNPPADL